MVSYGCISYVAGEILCILIIILKHCEHLVVDKTTVLSQVLQIADSGCACPRRDENGFQIKFMHQV